MRIESFALERRNDADRSEATVIWEDGPRAPVRVFFEVARDDGRALSIEPNAFLAACAIPALRDRERRIRVDAEVCPTLRDGMARAAALLRAWYPDLGRPPRVEAACGFRSPAPAKDRAALFLTGGVDSLHTLVRNREDVPPNHAESLRDAFFIEGVSFPEDDDAKRESLNRRGLAAVRAIATASGLAVSRIRTNALSLHADLEFFSHRSHGSFLAAAGLLSGAAVTDVTINASHSRKTGYRAWGSHPELDPEFSTAAVAIRHRGTEWTRLEKVRRIVESPIALESLFVCGQGPWPGPFPNCGVCEKCVRTRIELLLAGVESAPTFPPGPVTAEQIDETSMASAHRRLYFWGEIAAVTRAAGREDLADAIDRLRHRCHTIADWLDDRGWKGRLRRIDRKLMGGAMLAISRKVRSRASPRR